MRRPSVASSWRMNPGLAKLPPSACASRPSATAPPAPPPAPHPASPNPAQQVTQQRGVIRETPALEQLLGQAVDGRKVGVVEERDTPVACDFAPDAAELRDNHERVLAGERPPAQWRHERLPPGMEGAHV